MKSTDSYPLLRSLRVCLVKAGCFGIAPHKWEGHKLVLRYRRSNAFLIAIRSGRTPPPPQPHFPAYYTLTYIKMS